MTQISFSKQLRARAICYLSSERAKAKFSIFPPICWVPALRGGYFPLLLAQSARMRSCMLVTLTSSGSKWPMLAADLAALGSELSVRLSLAPPSSLDGWNLRHTNLKQQQRGSVAVTKLGNHVWGGMEHGTPHLQSWNGRGNLHFGNAIMQKTTL